MKGKRKANAYFPEPLWDKLEKYMARHHPEKGWNATVNWLLDHILDEEGELTVPVPERRLA